MAHKLSHCKTSVGMHFTNILLNFKSATNKCDKGETPISMNIYIFVYPFTTPIIISWLCPVCCRLCSVGLSHSRSFYFLSQHHICFGYFLSLSMFFEEISHKWKWYLTWTVMIPLCMTNITKVWILDQAGNILHDSLFLILIFIKFKV